MIDNFFFTKFPIFFLFFCTFSFIVNAFYMSLKTYLCYSNQIWSCNEWCPKWSKTETKVITYKNRLMNWCLTPTLALYQLYRGMNTHWQKQKRKVHFPAVLTKFATFYLKIFGTKKKEEICSSDGKKIISTKTKIFHINDDWKKNVLISIRK